MKLPGQVSGMFVFKVLNAHMGVFSWTRGLKFGHSLHLYLSLVCASIKESAHVPKLARMGLHYWSMRKDQKLVYKPNCFSFC